MEEHDPNNELYSKLDEYINNIGNISYYDENTSFKNEKKEKKRYNNSQFNINKHYCHDREKTNGMVRYEDLFIEIENYYLIYKLNRKFEEYKNIKEIEIIKNKRTSNSKEIVKKIHAILNYHQAIKDELNILVQNKHSIYKTFYSIFLNYYDKYSQIKQIKLNKNKIINHLRHYTNAERFEAIINNIETNGYQYFIDIFNRLQFEDDQNSTHSISTDTTISSSDNSYISEIGKADKADKADKDDKADKYSIGSSSSYDEVSELLQNTEWEIDQYEMSSDIEIEDKEGNEFGENSKEIVDLIKKKNLNIVTNKFQNKKYKKNIYSNNKLDSKKYDTFINNFPKKFYKKNGIKKKKNVKKNEIYYMLQSSEKAIKFFKKNPTYFNAKNKLTKYQYIIKRILKYVINIFRDVLNNTDLNIPYKKNGDVQNNIYDVMPYEQEIKYDHINMNTSNNNHILFNHQVRKKNNINEENNHNSSLFHTDKYTHKKNQDVTISLAKNNITEIIHPDSKTLFDIEKNGEEIKKRVYTDGHENRCNIKREECGEDVEKVYNNDAAGGGDVNGNNAATGGGGEDRMCRDIHAEDGDIKSDKISHEKWKSGCVENIVKNTSIFLTNDEQEIYKIYNNVNIVYFNKHINVIEYYDKYKIKCSCLKDIIHFIYLKFQDENDLYIDEYNSLESLYVSSRLKILNNNLLKNFDNFSKNYIPKYIKNICLLAIYITKLEVDLYNSIFNNNLNTSINIILNNIGLAIYENVNQTIYQLNNIKIIRKIIQILYLDIIEIYTDNIYNIIRDYFKKLSNILKERLLYIIEMHMSYYTKNTNSSIPYICFKPVKKKFINIISDFFAASNRDSNTGMNKETEINENKKYENKTSQNININNDKEKESQFETSSSDSAGSDDNNNYMEHTYNINMLNEKNVYKDLNFSNSQFSKDTTFSLTGIDVNIIGTILILKTLNYIIEQNIFIDIFKECLINSFNSLIYIYKENTKNNEDTGKNDNSTNTINIDLFLIKNLSFLIYLFYNVTNDTDYFKLYLNQELTHDLLYQQINNKIRKDKEITKIRDSTNITQGQEYSIFYFIKKVYNISSTDDIQYKILSSFNQSIHNFIITIIARVCFPLINILSVEYKDKLSEKEESIKNVLEKFLNGKNEQVDSQDNESSNYIKIDFSYLKNINFDLLQSYGKKFEEENGENEENGKNGENKENGKNDDINILKTNLDSFKKGLYKLFPKIYFYVKMFIISNTDNHFKGNNFFYSLFNYIIGILKYKIIFLLSEVYLLLRYKYPKYIKQIFEEKYIEDIFLFLKSNDYSCNFEDIQKCYELKKSYDIFSD
ncbi:conserved oligomeric Golgi complex subunit 3 [Plasmodium yoelii yoelii]|uniref:Conserved oligomeric Golgi complex subunit 3 n=2 Tax=Plasmodium yoelii TaxID=5861 RepID=A0AAE9WXD4_PLAYO|nr:conserved oligomeric Golgi complex subunit 3 [Plasmodium yoelii yoelii]